MDNDLRYLDIYFNSLWKLVIQNDFDMSQRYFEWFFWPHIKWKTKELIDFVHGMSFVLNWLAVLSRFISWNPHLLLLFFSRTESCVPLLAQDSILRITFYQYEEYYQSFTYVIIQHHIFRPFFSKVFIIMICIISFIKDRELICHVTIKTLKCGKKWNYLNFYIA